jgi:glycosyltransferase involved in cell wall biosynthesis
MMAKRILFLSKGANASSTRYRGLQYFNLLKVSGYVPTHITISGGLCPLLSAFYHASQADIVILLRKTFPAPIFWLLRQFSKKLIFDFDDSIFCNTDGSYSKTRMTRFIKTIQHCDYVFAGNQYLADVAKKFQYSTVIVPTSLDTQKYLVPQAKNPERFTLVWIGSHSTKRYIVGILSAIENAAKYIPNLQLKIIADFELSSESLRIVNVPWSEKVEAEEISSADVGLAPLPPDDWTKGKCALKVLQYMSAGLPVITSPTSVNAYVIENSKSGYHAGNDREWTESIFQAFKQREVLREMGAFGKDRVANEFDVKVVFKDILKILSTV